MPDHSSRVRKLHRKLSLLAAVATLIALSASIYAWYKGLGQLHMMIAVIWLLGFLWSLKEYLNSGATG